MGDAEATVGEEGIAGADEVVDPSGVVVEAPGTHAARGGSGTTRTCSPLPRCTSTTQRHQKLARRRSDPSLGFDLHRREAGVHRAEDVVVIEADVVGQGARGSRAGRRWPGRRERASRSSRARGPRFRSINAWNLSNRMFQS